ncbi:MAG: hypothetical protein ACK5MP_11580 [Nostocoides sp.]
MITLVHHLQSDLRDALRSRDRDRIATLRVALAALANAEAVPIRERDGAIEQSAVGVGASDVARRVLGPAEQRAILADEVTVMRSSATLYRDRDPQRSASLLREADALEAYLAQEREDV